MLPAQPRATARSGAAKGEAETGPSRATCLLPPGRLGTRPHSLAHRPEAPLSPLETGAAPRPEPEAQPAEGSARGPSSTPVFLSRGGDTEGGLLGAMPGAPQAAADPAERRPRSPGLASAAPPSAPRLPAAPGRGRPRRPQLPTRRRLLPPPLGSPAPAPSSSPPQGCWRWLGRARWPTSPLPSSARPPSRGQSPRSANRAGGRGLRAPGRRGSAAGLGPPRPARPNHQLPRGSRFRPARLGAPALLVTSALLPHLELSFGPAQPLAGILRNRPPRLWFLRL